MGLLRILFGHKDEKVASAKEYEGSPMHAFAEGAFQTVRFASLLLSVVGKWLMFFRKLEMDREALNLLSEKEIKCLSYNLPEFFGKE